MFVCSRGISFFFGRLRSIGNMIENVVVFLVRYYVTLFIFGKVSSEEATENKPYIMQGISNSSLYNSPGTLVNTNNSIKYVTEPSQN